MLLPTTRPDHTKRLPLTYKARLFVEMTSSYVLIRRWLRAKRVAEVAALARSAQSAQEPPQPERERREMAVRLAWVVGRTLNHLPGDTRCLTRSLVLVRLLARRGIETTLVIGVRAEDGFAAHAWVELDGIALLDPDEYAAGRLVEI